MCRLTVVATLFLLLAGCSQEEAAFWDGSIEQWGKLKQVIALGHSEGRVALTEVQGRKHAWGLGALEGLGGEVVIIDGDVWLARASKDDVTALSKAASKLDQATLLALAIVPSWNSVTLDSPVAWADFDAAIGALMREAGYDLTRPVPFRVSGLMDEVDYHVIGGECPHAAPGPDSSVHHNIENGVSGELVGFYFEGEAGILTHSGSLTHVHVFMQEGGLRLGHVDGVSLAADAIVHLPATGRAQ